MVLALYLRLSKEDDDFADESNSITNQRYILHKHIERKPEFDDFEQKEYVDDGYSGKNFERPAVTRLFNDVKAGKIYGIIVKDFSRFGRNHIEVGNYIEKIFPLLDIRFISVNNCFDSANYAGATPNMDVAFENLMYDYFSEENSVKIKNDLIKKRMRGNFMAVFAPYGYKKSQMNHNQILIDEEAAQVVRFIFEEFAKTGIKAEVARYLNNHKVPTPQEYARQKGISYNWKYKEEKKLWNGAIVGRILKNPVYIGNMAFHKKEVVETGSKKSRCLPKEEWKICENTHEPIVSKELFELVNSKNSKLCDAKLKKDTSYDSAIYCEGEKRKRGNKDSPIKGFVTCGGCMHHMIRRNRKNASYYCRHYYEVKAKGCCSCNIKEDELIQVVKDAICQQAIAAADLKELFTLYKESERKQTMNIKREIASLKNKIQACQNESFSLYERYQHEEINLHKFQELKWINQNERKMYQEKLHKLEIQDNQESPKDADAFFLLQGRQSMQELTRDTAEKLISKIFVYDKNKVEIRFQFKDLLKSLCH